MEKVQARHKLTGATQLVDPAAVDIPGGFFESIPAATNGKEKHTQPKPPASGDNPKE